MCYSVCDISRRLLSVSWKLWRRPQWVQTLGSTVGVMGRPCAGTWPSSAAGVGMLLPFALSSMQLCSSICFPLEHPLKTSHTSSQWSHEFAGRLAVPPLYLIASIWSVWATLLLFAQLLGNITLKHYMHDYVQLYKMNLFYLMLIL